MVLLHAVDETSVNLTSSTACSV